MLAIGCKNEEIMGHRTDSAIRIDGQRSDWNDIPIRFDEDNQTALGICHDSANIYLLFSFNKPIWARLIKSKGLKIWINNDGSKDKDFGLGYFGGPSMDEINALNGRDMPFPSDRQPPDMETDEQDDSMITVYSAKGMDMKIPANGTGDLAVAYGILNGICAYELKIPLDRIAGGETAQSDKIKIGLEWGGMDRPDGGSRMGRRGGDGMPGGGRPGGGGGRMPGGNRGEMQDFTERQEVWLTYDLSGGGE